MWVPGIPHVQGRNSYQDRDGRKFAIAIHNTSNDASDTNEAAYATRRTDGVSSHFYCDRDSVTQSLDTEARAGHAGSNTGNENAIAVEITGANGWSRATWLANVAWDQLGRVLAQVCNHYGITPRRASVAEMQNNPRVAAFYSHDDMRRAWGGTTHTDPGANFPWDRLFQAVTTALGGTPPLDPGGSGMAYDTHENNSRRLAAIFEMADTCYLFTDGTGTKDPKLFQVPVVAAIKALATQQQEMWEWLALLVDPGTPAGGRPGDRFHFPPSVMKAALAVPALAARVESLVGVVEALAATIQAGGGNVDVGAIMQGVDEKLNALAAETRDAVADLGEGGAAQVRGPQAD